MTRGIFTSEFWAMIGATVLNGIATAHQTGPVTTGTVGWNILPAIAYILSRGYAKGAPAQPIDPNIKPTT